LSDPREVTAGARATLARLIAAAAAAGLPETDEKATSYGRPAVRIRGKVIATVKDDDNFYLPCPHGLKEILLETAPQVYWQTDHYRGWPGLLARAIIGDDELAQRMSDAWRMQSAKLPKSKRR
jgi:hypothetical protein